MTSVSRGWAPPRTPSYDNRYLSRAADRRMFHRGGTGLSGGHMLGERKGYHVVCLRFGWRVSLSRGVEGICGRGLGP